MSVRPSPDMSARKIDWVPSANTTAGPASSSRGLANAHRGAESVFAERRVPGQNTSSSVIRMSAWPSPVEIDEAQIRIAPVEIGQRRRTAGTAPSPRPRSRSKNPGVGPLEDHADRAGRRPRGRGTAAADGVSANDGSRATSVTGSKRAETVRLAVVVEGEGDGTEIALVVPAVVLLGEHACRPSPSRSSH